MFASKVFWDIFTPEWFEIVDFVWHCSCCSIECSLFSTILDLYEAKGLFDELPYAFMDL